MPVGMEDGWPVSGTVWFFLCCLRLSANCLDVQHHPRDVRPCEQRTVLAGVALAESLLLASEPPCCRRVGDPFVTRLHEHRPLKVSHRAKGLVRPVPVPHVHAELVHEADARVDVAMRCTLRRNGEAPRPRERAASTGRLGGSVRSDGRTEAAVLWLRSPPVVKRHRCSAARRGY